MRIVLYGLPICSRCKTAKMMLDQRLKNGIIEGYEYQTSMELDCELPKLEIDNQTFYGKQALLEIRKIK